MQYNLLNRFLEKYFIKYLSFFKEGKGTPITRKDQDRERRKKKSQLKFRTDSGRGLRFWNRVRK